MTMLTGASPTTSEVTRPPAGRVHAPRRLPRWVTVGVAIALVAVALAVRWPFRDEVSGDYRMFIGPWYDYIAGHGGFAALRTQFANYNPPYLYLLVVATWLPMDKIVAVKLVSVVFDLLLAYAVYKLVSLHRGRTWLPLAAAAVALLLPTVVLNSSYWGQCDSIYASLGLLALYHQLRRRTVWAAVLIGLAIGFKLQAVFLLPVLAMVWVTQPIRWRRSLLAVVMVPLTFLGTLLPALAAGASLSSLLGIYPAQINGSGDGVAALGRGAGGGGPTQNGAGFGASGGGGFGGGGRGGFGGGNSGGFGGTTDTAPYTRNAASFYQWLSSDAGVFYRDLGFVLAGTAVAVALGVAWRHRGRITTPTLIAMSATLLVAIPFFLPEMHDRYFYLADAALVAGAFVVPRLAVSAVAAQAASLITYVDYLWNGTISLRWAATLELVALVAGVWAVSRSLRRTAGVPVTAGVPTTAGSPTAAGSSARES